MKFTIYFTILILLSLFIGSQVTAFNFNYTYDNLDRLVRVARDDGTVIEYTYDAAGNRLTKDVTAGAAGLQAPVTNLPPSKPGSIGLLPAPPSSSSPVASVSGSGSGSPLGGESVAHPAARQGSVASQETPVSQVGGALPVLKTAPAAGPPAPDRLGLAAAAGKVVLLWNGGAAHETGFVVQRQEGSDQENFEEIARPALPPGTGMRSVTWTDAQVKPGKSYVYRVAAYNAAGLSPFCPPLSVKVE
jgi:YD repeat-containing protein